MGTFADWSYPTSIRFGAGRMRELPEACVAAGIHRPLLVTDPGVAQLPMLATAVDQCRQAGLSIEVFADVRGNPVEANVSDGIEALRSGQHDGVIAMGGGSALDVGKVVALMANQTRPLWDFEDIGDWWKRANTAGILPIVALPTTAGTGSEVGRAAVIADPARRIKKVIFHPRMMPSVVISDPELTIGLPSQLTAWTGFDALAHCLEAYCAVGFHPMADGIAVEGIRLVHRFLQRAVNDGTDLEARAGMLVAASMGAVAFQKGLGAIHALSHPLGARCDTHHGLTNGVFMPYVLQWNRPAIETKCAALARYLALPAPSFEAFFDWALELRARLEIPETAGELGVEEGQLEGLAELAAVDPTAGGNPVPLTVADCAELYRRSFYGELAE